MSFVSSPGATVALAAFALLASFDAASATDGTNNGAAALAQTGTSLSAPSDITIDGGATPTVPSADAIVLDGDYVVTAGGTRSVAVLGAVTFDAAGTIVGGTLTFIGAEVAPAPAPTASPTTTAFTAATTATTLTDGSGLDGDDSLGGEASVDAAASGTATVTECAIAGGTYSLAGGGGGEAQLELDCAGSSLTSTWRLFVTGTQGPAVAQQVRAVPLEALPGAADSEIVDLTLTLR